MHGRDGRRAHDEYAAELIALDERLDALTRRASEEASFAERNRARGEAAEVRLQVRRSRPRRRWRSRKLPSSRDRPRPPNILREDLRSLGRYAAVVIIVLAITYGLMHGK